jgi:hypothetical protein
MPVKGQLRAYHPSRKAGFGWEPEHGEPCKADKQQLSAHYDCFGSFGIIWNYLSAKIKNFLEIAMVQYGN